MARLTVDSKLSCPVDGAHDGFHVRGVKSAQRFVELRIDPAHTAVDDADKGSPPMARNLVEIETVASRTLSILRERIPVTQAYLFGFHVEGIPDKDSDIDIAAFSPAADSMDAAARVALVIDVERQVDALVELHLYGASQYAEARPTNFFGYLLAHGRPIH